MNAFTNATQDIVFFDNTAEVKAAAVKIKLELPRGKQKFIYDIGAPVTTTPLSPHNLTGKVIARYMDNGYAYYTVQGASTSLVMREKDLRPS